MPHGISDQNFGLDSIPGYTAFHGGVAGRAHNEAGFRHFLSIELHRAGRSSHGLLLVLVALKTDDHRFSRLSPAIASRVFSALGACVREVDFVGWFREGQVAAAVLVQRAAPSLDMRQQVKDRVMNVLTLEQFERIGDIRVRVIPLRGRR